MPPVAASTRAAPRAPDERQGDERRRAPPAIAARCRRNRPRPVPASSRQSRPVQPPHEGVVGVAALHAHAGRRAGGPHRVVDLAQPDDEAVPRAAHPQGEVGVLAVGAGEALVEAVDGEQRRAPVGHVGRGPAGRLEPGRRALPVGGPAARRAAAPGSGPGEPPTSRREQREVDGEGPRPARAGARRRRRGTRPTRSSSARQPRLRAAAGPRPQPRTTRSGKGQDERSSRAGRRVGPVVDDDDLLRPRAALRGEAVEQRSRGSAGPPWARRRSRAGRQRSRRASSRRRAASGARGAGRRPARRPARTRSSSSASRGSSTIGRPAVLRLVLTTTGSPVRASNAREQRGHARRRRVVDGLHAGGAVDVDDGRDAVAPLRARPGARRACTGWAAARRGRSRRPARRAPSARPGGTARGP